MLDFMKTKIQNISLQRVGNKSKSESVIYCDYELQVDESMERALLKMFLSGFSQNDYFYEFTHHDNVKFNEIKLYCENILSNQKSFIDNCNKIAGHLYEMGIHPNIKSGELFITNFSGVIFNNKKCKCIGIFKTENKDDFITYEEQKQLNAKLEEGTNINSLDKGALIIYSDCLENPKILISEKKSLDTNYWINNFLGLKLSCNNAYITENVMNACLAFSKQKQESDIEKQDLISLNNYISGYFEENSEFSATDFFKGVDNDYISDEFKEFICETAEDLSINIDSFKLDTNRVSKINKKIRNIIKLDTNIELKINSSNNDTLVNIEKGFDESKKMFFYKVYFNEELY